MCIKETAVIASNLFSNSLVLVKVSSLRFAHVWGLEKKMSTPGFPAVTQFVSVDLNILSLT